MLRRFRLTIVVVGIIWAHVNSQTAERPQKILLRHLTIDPTELGPVGGDLNLLDVAILQHYIVQFPSPVISSTKDAVRDLVGHNLTLYIPNNAFVVYTDMETIAKVQLMDGIIWAGLWQPEYKYTSSPEVQNEFNDQFNLAVFLGPIKDLEGFVQDLPAKALAELGCTFEAQVLNRERLVLTKIAYNGIPVEANSQLNPIYEWLSLQPEVYHISQYEPIQMHNYWAKSIVQNDDPAGRADSDLLFAQNDKAKRRKQIV